MSLDTGAEERPFNVFRAKALSVVHLGCIVLSSWKTRTRAQVDVSDGFADSGKHLGRTPSEGRECRMSS